MYIFRLFLHSQTKFTSMRSQKIAGHHRFLRRTADSPRAFPSALTYLFQLESKEKIAVLCIENIESSYVCVCVCAASLL